MSFPNTSPYHLPPDAVWFITGCSSGIGLALAHLLSQSSYRVVATARKIASLSEIPDNDNVLKLELDVTATNAIDEALKATLDKFRRIDIVVNNAGYTLSGDTEVTSEQEARAIMDTNFWGMVNVSTRCLRILREENPKSGQQGGVILNMSSMGGYIGYPGQAFYHATKFAMEGWTESVSKELPLAWNIHMCSLEPGGVKTNFATSSLKSVAKRHPAYADPSYPAKQLLDYIKSEQGRAFWAEPMALAKAILELVSRGQRIPIRLPLGPDAWGMVVKDVESTQKELEEFKDLSLSVGDSKQLETIGFLTKS
ncbi:NAD(P)-binding protein [Xylaria bambusicola]|uniref:NAD(P)-binding protein n=1 Tax=Xylaria bambusicola TaxID=326684 RepID=UPI0020075DC0|nr:NAD(P)-binding protein [Xylaria bambusicola]KAI0509139.1 NAD(P)-binding protein [Xylaria bambusicola]